MYRQSTEKEYHRQMSKMPSMKQTVKPTLIRSMARRLSHMPTETCNLARASSLFQSSSTPFHNLGACIASVCVNILRYSDFLILDVLLKKSPLRERKRLQDLIKIAVFQHKQFSQGFDLILGLVEVQYDVVY